jgi:hypothetical protein
MDFLGVSLSSCAAAGTQGTERRIEPAHRPLAI